MLERNGEDRDFLKAVSAEKSILLKLTFKAEACRTLDLGGSGRDLLKTAVKIRLFFQKLVNFLLSP